MLQVPFCQVPPIGQFSMASFTPLSSAWRASSPNTSLKRGMAASTDSPSSAPANVLTVFVPKASAMSMQPCSSFS